MRPPIHLTFEAMVGLLGRTIDRLPDAPVLAPFATEPTSLLASLRGTGHWLLVLPESNDAELLASLRKEVAALTERFEAPIAARFVLPEGSTPDAGDESVLVDIDGLVRERLAVRGTAIALVRPDGYVGFRGHAGSFAKLARHLQTYLVRSSERVVNEPQTATRAC